MAEGLPAEALETRTFEAAVPPITFLGTNRAAIAPQREPRGASGQARKSAALGRQSPVCPCAVAALRPWSTLWLTSFPRMLPPAPESPPLRGNPRTASIHF